MNRGETMARTTSNGQSRAFFSAVYDALRLGDGTASVYKNDDGRYWAGSSGAFRGQLQPTPPREVESNVSLDAYLSYGNLSDITRDEFVSMCIECGFTVPADQDDE